ncbi:LexA family protein [Aeromonas jandaei]|uniref:LexA family protein n=1 Tax=Aeromonas jandaei TaxID=650 RepID=UPI0039871AFA
MKNEHLIRGERVKALRENQGLSQAALAEKCGWASQSRIGNYEVGTRKISADDAVVLAKALGVVPEAILFGRPTLSHDLRSSGLTPVSKNDIKMVPLISWVQAGEFCLSDALELPFEDLEFYACPNPKAGPRTFALKVRGDSMTNPHGGRSYPEGNIIFVDPDHQPKVGARVIAYLEDGSCTFKELAENEMGKHYLKALNPRYTINDHIEPVKIFGVVIGSYAPE